MKTIIITALLLFMNDGSVGVFAPHKIESSVSIVYVCTGSNSKRYHKTDECWGLNSCSGDIVRVSIEKARQMGRTPCKICYK